MTRLLDLLARLRRVLFRYFLAWLALFAALTVFPVAPSFYATGAATGLLWSSNAFGNSASAWVLRGLETALLPTGETLLVVAPFDPLLVITEIGAFFATLAVGTYGLARLARFAWKGLRPAERQYARWLLAAIPLLLAAGAFVGFSVLPYAYLWTYQLAGFAGAAPTISLTEFVSTTLIFVLSIGLSFEIPVLIAGLTAAGILSTATLRGHWRIAVMGCWIAAFAISPGVGGGWIEIPLGLGLSGLFYAGYVAAKRIERKRNEAASGHVDSRAANDS